MDEKDCAAERAERVAAFEELLKEFREEQAIIRPNGEPARDHWTTAFRGEQLDDNPQFTQGPAGQYKP